MDKETRKEYVTISDAINYIAARTGFAFERKTLTRYIEAGAITINGKKLDIIADQIELRWFISRTSIEAIIKALLPNSDKE